MGGPTLQKRLRDNFGEDQLELGRSFQSFRGFSVKYAPTHEWFKSSSLDSAGFDGGRLETPRFRCPFFGLEKGLSVGPCGHGLHHLWRAILGVEHPCATYFDVYQYRVLTHSHVFVANERFGLVLAIPLRK